MRRAALLLALPEFVFAQGRASTRPADVLVDPRGSVQTITAALALAAPGATIRVRAGVYREPTIVVTKPVTLDGGGAAVLDGGNTHAIMIVLADDVTVRGFTFRHTGRSRVEDRAALRLTNVRRCVVERNRVEDAFFAIYLERTADCEVSHNDVSGAGAAETLAGNGIHAWQSERPLIANNRIRGQRDGIYFEFVTAGIVRDNVSEENERYGLHFMFSDDCRYERNVFRANHSGVAVMYAHRVHMVANTFSHNWGATAYGLLLKEISDGEIRGNRFISNSTALFLEGSNRNRVEENLFRENGWAVKLLADAQDNLLTHNVLERNTFDVGTNSRESFSTFQENYWDRYRGYDLDRDGIGDVPHAPVRLFALVVEQSPATMLLLRSVLVDVLDLAERMLPVLTPRAMVDARPLLHPPAGVADVNVPAAPVSLSRAGS